MHSTPAWAWEIFGAGLLVLLALDMFLHRGGREQSHRAALIWSAIWISVGLSFAVVPGILFGATGAHEYLAAYLIEEALSLDNLFVFLIVFKTLKIPSAHQRRALSWGIFGALAFRALFIFLGVATLERWAWLEYIFGAVLLYAAWHAFRQDPAEETENTAVEWLSRRLPITKKGDTSHFFVIEKGRRLATPLLVAVLAIELTDIVFAIDSVPAALSVSRNEFIVYSSNALAILGLRSLYLVLQHTLKQLRYLHYGLAGVLAFAALKMLLAHWIEIPPLWSVAVIATVIGAAAWASLRAGKLPERKKPVRAAAKTSSARSKAQQA